MNNKALVILLIIAVTMTTSCSNRKVNEVELYGNTFICIMDFDDYDVPDDWKEYDLMDGACSIMMPPNMRQTKMDGWDVIDEKRGTNFSYVDTVCYENDSVDWGRFLTEQKKEHYYVRVYIDYMRGIAGTFAKPQDDVYNVDVMRQLEQMAYDEVEDKDLILNGPFVDMFPTNRWNRDKVVPEYANILDTYYRRKGLTGDGPVSVHIFIIQNDDKAVKMMMAYHDKDSLEFKDLFKSVKTFKWKQ